MVPSARVSDLAEQVRGVTYGKDDASRTPASGYLPILRAGNITDAGLVFDDLVYVPAAKVSAKQKIKQGDIVIAASSGSIDVVGKAAPALRAFEGGFGAFCKVIRPNDKVDAGYLAQFFKTPNYRRTISSLAAGANINNLKSEHLDDLLLPLPALPEQRRIAAILDQADALRAKRREALAHLDSLTQSIFIEMFGDSTVNPMGWPQPCLGELLESGPQNGLYKPSTDYGTGTPILRIDAFYDGAVTKLTTLKRVRVTAEEVRVFGLAVEDVVINRVNSIEYLGKCALIPALQEPTVFESNMMRFKVASERVLPTYLVAFLQVPFIKEQIRAASKDAVNQSSINQQDVKAFKINVPPLALQRTFATRIQAVDALKTTHRAALAELDALFASLQHRAFSGGL